MKYPPKKWPARLMILAIRLYQGCIAAFLPPSCRHSPSCSAYGIEAIERHGAIRGLVLLSKRILRCHPFGSAGYDPVPKKKN